MFVKLERVIGDKGWVSADRGVAPAQTKPRKVFMYEADSIEFQKHAALEENEPLPVSPYGNAHLPFGFPEREQEEYFNILCRKGNSAKHIVAAGCTMYIMNDQGKTIDAVRLNG